MWISFFTDDLLFKAVASQTPKVIGQNYVASKAIDGNTATCMRTDSIGENSPYKSMWWKVNLGAVYSIYSIHILFKNYDGYGMYVFICTNQKRASLRAVNRFLE